MCTFEIKGEIDRLETAAKFRHWYYGFAASVEDP